MGYILHAPHNRKSLNHETSGHSHSSSLRRDLRYLLRKSGTISDLASDVTMVVLIVLATGIGIKGSFKKD